MRAKEIERKINGSTLSQDEKIKGIINSKDVINFAEKYRTEHPDEYKDTSRK